MSLMSMYIGSGASERSQEQRETKERQEIEKRTGDRIRNALTRYAGSHPIFWRGERQKVNGPTPVAREDLPSVADLGECRECKVSIEDARAADALDALLKEAIYSSRQLALSLEIEEQRAAVARAEENVAMFEGNISVLRDPCPVCE
jgi:hypothetical protein